MKKFTISIRVDENLKNLLEQYAAVDGITVSEYTRSVVSYEINEQEEISKRPPEYVIL
ncbi:DUF6290 family protein [Neptunitalea lumnitzerae]|uniref:Ribbon-helix-helix protein, copG family n=1 Tax=Neptunitalea lumnitzerae TaxID=2965509 RepID=A0ABQ5MEB6_9FLAO|nr:DUF6290 family protein [Neptunitalea sp. Y10]GLB47692.1 hypothetical protein Y10_00600 [Neptunitalea sp. Y10]